jgi:hypothetical protein
MSTSGDVFEVGDCAVRGEVQVLSVVMPLAEQLNMPGTTQSFIH